MVNRRTANSFGLSALFGGISMGSLTAFASHGADAARAGAAHHRLRELELAAQGRLGVHIIDTATGQEFGHRADDRFMMLSSFKLLAAAVVLSRVDRGLDALDRRISYTKNDLVTYSPVTEKFADGQGMTLGELCEATITTSDNTAANLILASFGGPAALTASVKQLGDSVTRLDRIETELNFRQSNALLDTTTARAMAQTMQKYVLGDALTQPSRTRLQQWLLGNTTGGKRLKAGLPADWRIGDKTGTNQTDMNDIGVVWPPNRKPWLVTAYLADSRASNEVRETTLAQVGALVRTLAG